VTSPAQPPSFPRHDPATPAFWDVRFEAEFTPWDQGAVPACLADYVNRTPPPASVLVPGCGSAHEMRLFADAGWPATAIDFSAAAVNRARSRLGALGARVMEADFFADGVFTHPVDLVYERAFMCALPRQMREAWAKRVAELLQPGGRLAGFFYFDQTDRGPPFGIEPGELAALLRPAFDLIEEATPGDSIPVFAGKERWQVWQRR